MIKFSFLHIFQVKLVNNEVKFNPPNFQPSKIQFFLLCAKYDFDFMKMYFKLLSVDQTSFSNVILKLASPIFKKGAA